MSREQRRHRRRVPTTSSPFADAVPAVVSAVLFGTASVAWLLAQQWLPGTRWVVVHLFTLGVLTSLITAFTRHFAASFTNQGTPNGRGRALVAALVLDVSVLALLVGRLVHAKVLLAIGTLGLVGIVGLNLLALRAIRRDAGASQLVWVVRRYEDAHLAFLAAAVLGTLVGVEAVTGGWWAGTRDAHMHLNMLGWAGVTVLVTLVVFGPTLVCTRMSPGADARAGTALRAAPIALLATAAGLVVAGGADGVTAMLARIVAVAGLLTYGWVALVVARGVGRMLRASPDTPLWWPLAGIAGWLPVGIALDVVVVATNQRQAFDAVGVILFIGVLAQLVLAVLLYLMPQLRGHGRGEREMLARRVGRLARVRTVVLNAGVLAVVSGIGASVVFDVSMEKIVRLGWFVIAVGVGAHLVPVAWPVSSRAA